MWRHTTNIWFDEETTCHYNLVLITHINKMLWTLEILISKNKCLKDYLSTNLEGQVKDNLVLPTFPATGPMSITSARRWDRASITNPTCSSFTYTSDFKESQAHHGFLCESYYMYTSNPYLNRDFFNRLKFLSIFSFIPDSVVEHWTECEKNLRRSAEKQQSKYKFAIMD